MNYEEYKKKLFSPKTDKKVWLMQAKIFFPDFLKLQKVISRIEKELPGYRSLIQEAILGENYIPKSYNKLHQGKSRVFSDSLQQEVNWLAIGIIKCSEVINKFIKYRNDFEYYLLTAQYKEAREVLEKIETEVCVSYWTIENKFILDEYEYGSERNWETRNEILDESNDAIVKLLGNLYSIKAEKRVSFFQYNDEFNNWQEQEFGGTDLYYFIEYFRLKANYFSLRKYESYSKIIFLENGASIIDRYILFIRIVQHLVTEQNETNSFLLNVLEELVKGIDDKNLKQLLLIKGKYTLIENDYDTEVLNAIDQYTLSNYQKSVENISEIIQNRYVIYLELIEVYIKSLIEKSSYYIPITKEDSIVNQIAKCYFNVLSKNDDTDQSILELLKFSYIFNNSHLGLHIYSFLKEELGWNSDLDYTLLSRLSSNFFNPKLWESIYEKEYETEHFVNALIQQSENSITTKLFASFHDNYTGKNQLENPGVTNNTKYKLYCLRNHLLKNDIDQAIIGYSELLTQDLSIISEYETVSNLYYCYLKTNNYRSCLSLYVSSYIKNTHLVKKCDSISLLDAIIKGKYKNIGEKESLIELPIFFKINSPEKIKIKQAYEQFLNANSCDRPSKLTFLKDRFEKNKFIFFLKNVCTQEIMQLSKYLNSTLIVNEERILICQFLAEYDTDNIELYNSEIASTTQKNIINKVIGGIDERKIYVNDERIKQYLIKTDKSTSVTKEQITILSKDSFERYINLIEFVKDKEYKNYNTVLHINEEGEPTFVESEKKEFTRDEYDFILDPKVFKMFTDFFLSIRDQFVFSGDYGLDGYLSSKIRHGTLPNHLRSVFETYHLVTSQEDGIYSINKYWEEKIQLPEEKIIKIQNILAEFSKEIDELSKTVKEELIQCKSEKKTTLPDALFDYTYERTELILLFVNEFSDIKDYETFIDKSINELWNRTEICLTVIRTLFESEIKASFNKTTSELERALLLVTDRNDISELLNHINLCRTEIQIKLRNIENWFRRSENKYDGRYELKTLMEASIQIIKNINPSYKFDISKNIDITLFIDGEHHQHFIDVINFFLQNMIYHSKLDIDELHADLQLRKDKNFVSIDFKNNVSDKINQTELIDKLTYVKSNWENADINASKDRDSGFPKVKKILRSDLNREQSKFNFSLSENKLTISLSFETENLIYENSDN